MSLYAVIRTISEYTGYPILYGVFAHESEAGLARERYLKEVASVDPFAEQAYRENFDVAADTQIAPIPKIGMVKDTVFLVVSREEAFGQCRAEILQGHAHKESAKSYAQSLEANSKFAHWFEVVRVELGKGQGGEGYLSLGDQCTASQDEVE